MSNKGRPYFVSYYVSLTMMSKLCILRQLISIMTYRLERS